MPELPEVETIARRLAHGSPPTQPTLIGCQVTDAHILWARTLACPDVQAFAATLRGQSVQAVSRRGKYVVISFTTHTLLIHLRMSGDLRVEDMAAEDGSTLPLQKHDRLALEFSNGMRLVFNDTRKFGRAWLVEDPQEVLDGLGPEPLDPALTIESFQSMLARRARQLKPLLMDQRFLAGLGNIYADEALHLAGLHPLRLSSTLISEESERLPAAIRAVLSEGIRRNGASIDWVYRGGDFQNYFRVYGRTGQPCPACGTLIQRLVVGQRGTHICPKCQFLS